MLVDGSRRLAIVVAIGLALPLVAAPARFAGPRLIVFSGGTLPRRVIVGKVADLPTLWSSLQRRPAAEGSTLERRSSLDVSYYATSDTTFVLVDGRDPATDRGRMYLGTASLPPIIHVKSTSYGNMTGPMYREGWYAVSPDGERILARYGVPTRAIPVVAR